MKPKKKKMRAEFYIPVSGASAVVRGSREEVTAISRWLTYHGWNRKRKVKK